MEPMEYNQQVTEVILAFRGMADEERKRRSEGYAPTAMEVIGISATQLRAVIREMRRRYAGWTEQQWLAFCQALVDRSIFECQAFAYEVIGRDEKLLRALDRQQLKGLMKNLDNWGSVDQFGVGIHGILWRRGVVTDGDIVALLESDNHWMRRLAVVSTVALNLKSRGGTGDTERTLRVCEAVAGDRHDMLQKALSWSLRELSKRDPGAVSEFLQKHHQILAGRVIREVNHKLRFGTKN
jgi:3-methyladenine DNA glycosylase AlkD